MRLAFIGIFALWAGIAQGADYCISGDGSGDWPDACQAKAGPDCAGVAPCSLAMANQNLACGERALLLAGTYADQFRPAKSCPSDANRIVYQAYGDGIVTVSHFESRSGQEPEKGTFALGQRNYITVSGKSAINAADDTRLIQHRPEGKAPNSANLCGAEGNIIEYLDFDCGWRGDATSACSRLLVFCAPWAATYGDTRYNVVRHNKIKGYSQPLRPQGRKGPKRTDYTEDAITTGGSVYGNLIENNEILEAVHVSLRVTEALNYAFVIRGNDIFNPSHTAVSIYRTGHSVPEGARVLMENNRLRATYHTPCNPDGLPGQVLQVGSAENLVRHNIISEGGSPGDAASGCARQLGAIAGSAGRGDHGIWQNRFLNNTVVKNYAFGIGVRATGPATRIGENKFWNNFVYDSNEHKKHANPTTFHIIYWDRNHDTNDRHVANVYGAPGYSFRTPFFKSNKRKVPPLDFSGMIRRLRNPGNPEFTPWNGFENLFDPDLNTNTFVNYGKGDYTLRAGSRYRDKGAPVTRVAAADKGSGKTLVVEDSRWFYSEVDLFPSWMGIRWDWICVGSDASRIGTDCVQLAGVDDATNTLTLAKSVSRRDGAFVWLWKDSSGRQVVHGRAPDIGALEYGASR